MSKEEHEHFDYMTTLRLERDARKAVGDDMAAFIEAILKTEELKPEPWEVIVGQCKALLVQWRGMA